MPTGTITALAAQAHDSQRVNVFVDGTFALGVSLTIVAHEKLFVGKVLDEEAYGRLELAERSDRAVHAALRFLEARPRSTAEIRERLRRKGFEPELVEPTLERLHDLGLVDDAAFARFWVENRQAWRPRGAAALRDELRRKGVDRTTIQHVLDEQSVADGEGERAITLARAAVRKYADAPDRATFGRRLGGYLQRRGFSFETVRPIVDRLWEELKGSDER